MLPVDNYTYSLLTPGLGYALSCLGAFTGLRCAARARALQGAARTRWLLVAGTSIGTTGVWGAQFIALLGVTVPGQVIRYSVVLTLLSVVVAAAGVCAGLGITGWGRGRPRSLLAGTLVTGLGLAGMHSLGLAALRLPGRTGYAAGPFALSIALAAVAAAVTLRAALRLRGRWPALIGSLLIGAAVTGTNYTGLAALRLYRAAAPLGAAGGATAQSLLLPLIVGICLVTFLVTAAIAWSPSEDEINYDAALLAHVHRRNATTAPLRPWTIERPARSPAGSLFAANGDANNGATVKGLPPWIISELRKAPSGAPRRQNAHDQAM